MTPENQLELFNQAIEALGGSRTTARALGCTERTIARLRAGQTPLHEGWLRDVSAALLTHAENCRKLERALSPAFAGNLIEGQAREDGRRARWEN